MTGDLPSDPPLRTATLAGGGEVSYTDEGSGPVIVLLHGLPGSARDFRWLAPAMASVRLLRIEQPGFGNTPLTTEPRYTLEARARFVGRALDALGVDRCVLLGHSLGGPLAIRVAGDLGPERVRRLALVASIGVRPHRAVRLFGRYPDLARVLESFIARRLLMRAMRAGLTKAGFPRKTPDAAVLQSTRVFHGLQFDAIRAAVREVRVPTFVSWADDDRLVEPTIALELGAMLPAGPRIAFPDGGHNIQKTRAIELGTALSAWAQE